MAALSETKYIWRNGSFVAWADAQVHVLAHSMQFGSSAFEGIRCYSTPKGPAIFRLRDHLVRLMNSCKIYRMPVPFDIDTIFNACRELVVKNEIDSCYVRPMVLRGFGAAGMVPFESPVEVYLPCWPWGAYLGNDAQEKGINAGVSSWNRVTPNTLPAAAKVAGNYLSSQLIKMEALANGFDEAIALGTGGMISEGSGQNVFLVADGVLCTPPLDGTLLPGITRSSILALATDLGIPVREQPMMRESLYTAEEVFICGTATEVVPVATVDRIPVADGKPGPITKALQNAFLDTVNGRNDDKHGWLTYCRD